MPKYFETRRLEIPTESILCRFQAGSRFTVTAPYSITHTETADGWSRHAHHSTAEVAEVISQVLSEQLGEPVEAGHVEDFRPNPYNGTIRVDLKRPVAG